MADKQYRPWNIDQDILFPPVLRDWVPADHLVFRFLEAVNVLDISAITRDIDASDPRGNRPYHPRMMLALLVFAYSSGLYSSRRIASVTYDSVPFRVLTGDEHPHFTVINDFRARHRKAVKDLFLQVLRLCGRAGLVDLEHIAVDGSKVKANASKHKAMSYERMKQELERLEGEVGAMLDRADQVDAEEDAQYGVGHDAHEIPEELKRREERKRRIQKAKEELEREAAAAREKVLRQRAKEQRERAEKESDLVERKRKESRARKAEERANRLAELQPGREDQAAAEDPEPTLPEHQVATTPKGEPQPTAQRNFTDPDSRIMKRDGSFLQGYNCQCAVDSKRQIIVAEAVTNQAPDQEHLVPLIERLEQNLGQLPKRISADAGYMSEDNAEYCENREVDAHLSVRRERHGPQDGSSDAEDPAQNPIWAKMKAKLITPEGRKVYARRKAIVEPVFGQIKEARGFRRFSLRGIHKVRTEWTLVCLCHNLLKLMRSVPGPLAEIQAQGEELIASASP